MSIKVEIIADSLNPMGCRLTTYILEYPRFVHAELMTHRMFSKNAASSRAIPIEKMIQQVIDNPAMPVWWGKNQSGMQAKEELDETTFLRDFNHPYFEKYKLKFTTFTARSLAKHTWLQARDSAIECVRRLDAVGLHKQIANRILEPWFNIRIILSGTEFENFFALRVHPDAQPEICALATLMLEAYNKSEPKLLKAGEWHIPFGDKFDKAQYIELLDKSPNDFMTHGNLGYANPKSLIEMVKIKVAIARCARISYFNYDGKDNYDADIKLCDRLFGSIPRHLSPTEHVAQAMDDKNFIGNFKGFRQYRYFFSDQNLKDSRVKIRNERGTANIVVNSEKKVIDIPPSGKLTYEDIYTLAYPNLEKGYVLSCVYSFKGRDGTMGGAILSRGQSVDITEGMNFTIVDTSNA